jgi:hypothetical protein
MIRPMMLSLAPAWRNAARLFSATTLVAMTLASVVLLTSCSYRMAGVQPLGEPIRIEISTNKSRLVRIQGYLQEALAGEIENHLGWRVSPTGSAKIELFIDEEVVEGRGNDDRGIASRWTITSHGRALFTSRHGTATTEWTGTGYSAGLSDEADALKNAANNAANSLATWLENQSEQWSAPTN